VIFDNILHMLRLRGRSESNHFPPSLSAFSINCSRRTARFRYQVAAEVRADLKRLQREIDSGRVAAASSARITSVPAPPSTAVAQTTGKKTFGALQHGQKDRRCLRRLG